MNAKSTQTFSKTTLRRVRLLLIILFVIALLGIFYRIVEYIILKHATNQQAVLNVAVVKAAREPSSREIILPGSVWAWHEATIYARTSGYVIEWKVDIGAHVKTGDLLAVIATPEVDAQLRQTEADLKTAEANYALAQTTAVRWKNLLKTNSVSHQEAEEKIADEKAKAAIVASTRANRDRLRDLASFERVIAPFDGVIMSRTTDIGRLINAGNGTVPLFRLVQTDKLRVYVKVPQYYSAAILPGLTAQLYFTEHPGKSYPAKLLDTAKAIDYKTRTLLVQFEMDNPTGELLSGSYTEAHLMIPASQTAVRLPVNTLIFRAQGLQVATLDADNKVILKPITLGHDYGQSVEVATGLTVGEVVIINPPDSIYAGEAVHVVPAAGNPKEVKKA